MTFQKEIGMQPMDVAKLIKRVVVFVAVVVTAWIFWPLASVPAGHMGVVALFGSVSPEPLSPGLRFVTPLSKVHFVDVRISKHDSQGDAASKDLQGVHTMITTNFNVLPSAAAKLYSEVGMDYADKLFDGAVQETFKAITANYTAEELIKKREHVTAEITQLFKQKISSLSGDSIRIDAVFVKNFEFGKAFNQAIEQKQVAEQNALKASRDLERIKIEAEQVRAKAQGEADAVVMAAKADAEAFKLKSVTLTGQMLQMASIEKWNGALPSYMGSGAPVPFLSVK